jgi:hypothetical protein
MIDAATVWARQCFSKSPWIVSCTDIASTVRGAPRKTLERATASPGGSATSRSELFSALREPSALSLVGLIIYE